LDRIKTEQRSKIMSAIRSKDTRPEVLLRKALWAKGMRFRKQYGKERIDVAFPSHKLAIFVDGCFWHGCPIHSRLPKSHKEYWHPKLKRNRERDKAKEERLELEGWRILRFWEHEMKSLDPIIKKIQIALNRDTSFARLNR
jgi:DNA mismatch endonuclease (patch repair protein)